MTRFRRSSGFTLVELNLAIVFVALLVLAVAMTTMSVSRTYQYGVSLKTINQLGREVTDQMRRDIAAASPTQIQFVEAGGAGALCLGTVSYAYNSADLLNSSGTKILQSGDPVNLVRFDDRNREMCLGGSLTLPTSEITEILATNTTELAVHDMEFRNLLTTNEGGVNEGVVELNLSIGTAEIGTTDSDAKCLPPTDPSENFNNCAVREFALVVRVTGGETQ